MIPAQATELKRLRRQTGIKWRGPMACVRGFTQPSSPVYKCSIQPGLPPHISTTRGPPLRGRHVKMPPHGFASIHPETIPDHLLKRSGVVMMRVYAVHAQERPQPCRESVNHQQRGASGTQHARDFVKSAAAGSSDANPLCRIIGIMDQPKRPAPHVRTRGPSKRPHVSPKRAPSCRQYLGMSRF
jgi:hypothetical protein